jgi:hypothetical protein
VVLVPLQCPFAFPSSSEDISGETQCCGYKLQPILISHHRIYLIFLRIKLPSVERDDIIRMMKSRRMRWAGLLARMRATRNAYIHIGGKARRKEATRKTKT